MKRFFIIIAAGILFHSCIKDSHKIYETSEVATGIIIPNSNWPAGCTLGIRDSILSPLASQVIFRLYAKISRSGTPDRDLTIHFEADSNLVHEFNRSTCTDGSGPGPGTPPGGGGPGTPPGSGGPGGPPGSGGPGGGSLAPDYVVLPDTCYRVTSWQLTIPAGSREAFLPVEIYPGKIKPGVRYMLAVAIKDEGSEMIAANFRYMLFPLRK